ncbi:MAG: TldD/PmbA family protein [bacterium]|nr:TldD/PmbA family protein [bacterium]
MPLPTQDQALDFLQSVVAASDADETEVTLDATEDRFARFAEEGPTQSGDRERVDLAVRVRVADPGGGFKEARATCGSLDLADARAALERATILARMGHTNAELVPLGGAVDVPETAPERPTLDHTFREKADWVRAALGACKAEELAPSGLARTTGMTRTIVNSAGRAVHGARTRASFAVTASAKDGEGGSGFAEQSHANVERISHESVIRRAVSKAVQNRTPQAIEPGEYTVVLEPSAVSSLLLFAAYHGFGAQEVDERSSLLCGRVGERLFPDALRVVDDARNEVYPGFLFDGEGQPKQRVELLENGAFSGPVTDSRWARKLGAENTGHGVPQPSTDGPAATNLCVAAGHHSLEQLIADVDDGLLVSQFHYTNMIEPLALTLTGMTRNGTFRIQNGKITGPVRNLRFTETLVNALSRVTGVGRDLEVAGALFDGEVVCPALRVDRFRFTSTTDF